MSTNKSNAKAPKKGEIAIPFLLTFFVTLVLLGGAAMYAFSIITGDEISQSNAESELKSAVPTAEMDHTLLMVYENGTDDNDLAFVLLHCMPSSLRVLCIPVSPTTSVTLSDQSNTVGGFYRSVGIEKASLAITEMTGLEIDRHIVLNYLGLEKLHSIMGGLKLYIPAGFEDITPGEHSVSASQLAAYLTFDSYQGGEEYRTSYIGVAAQSYINQNFSMVLYDRIRINYTSLLNLATTDITAADYSKYASAVEYLVSNASNTCAELILPSGQWTDNGFVYNESFPADVQYWLNS